MTLIQFQPKGQPESFDQFWECYPVKHAKKDARKAWAQLNPTDDLVQKICAHLELRIKTRQWREGFIPYPATFLRGERWEDVLTQEDFYQAKL